MSLEQLAVIMGIPLKQGWKTEIAKFFKVPLSVLSNWIGRGSLPKRRLIYAEKEGYALSRWYRVKTNYHVMSETISPISKDNQRSPSAEPYSLDQKSLDNMQVTWMHIRVRPEHEGVLTDVQAILESGESGTIRALKENVREFKEKVVEKRELLRRIEKLESMYDREKNFNDLSSSVVENAGNDC